MTPILPGILPVRNLKAYNHKRMSAFREKVYSSSNAPVYN